MTRISNVETLRSHGKGFLVQAFSYERNLECRMTSVLQVVNKFIEGMKKRARDLFFLAKEKICRSEFLTKRKLSKPIGSY
jgi:hypothetical protein